MKKVYIIILNYNNPADTIACLDSVCKLDYDNFHIVLCDNASTDNSNFLFNKWQKNKNISNFTYVRLAVNGGYAKGNNVGIEFALSQKDMEYVWVLNNDTIVTPMSLTNVVNVIEKDAYVGVCGSKLVYDWDRKKVQGYGGRLNSYLGTTSVIINESDLSTIDFVIGAAMLISRKFLENVGLFSEDYFLYYEEIDLAKRAKDRYKMACAVNSIVYHKEGATIGANNKQKNTKSLLADYFSIRNRLLFMKKYYTLRLPFVYMGLLVTMFNRVRRSQYDRIPMILKLMVGIKDVSFEHLVEGKYIEKSINNNGNL